MRALGIAVIVIHFTLMSLCVNGQEAIVLTIDQNQISKSEFENIFKKNNRDSVITKEALDEYMELFINYKLKVMEAESLKIDTISALIKELDGYRKQLARPYLVDKNLTEELLQEAYDRMKYEIKAAHILVKLPVNPTPEDTLASYNKIQEIREKIVIGKQDFETLAVQFSDDPSAKTNNGNLGYFTSLQMVYPFESAAYKTNVGAISAPVRTKFGYHLVKVIDRRDARGEINAAHIMIQVKEEDSQEKKDAAKSKIDEIYAKIIEGEDFGNLAKQFSDDKTSGAKGGVLPWFSTGKMVEEFENAAFALQNIGDVSEPIKTQYGWHIIKKLDYRPLATFDEVKGNLKSKISKDARAEITKHSFLNRMKNEYKYRGYPENLYPLYNIVDSNIFDGNWTLPNLKSYSRPLFSIGDKNYSQSDFLSHLIERQRKGPKQNIDEYVKNRYEKYESDLITEYEESRLEFKYPEFKALMKEYHDGVLLFELTEQKVWKKASADSVGLANFYQTHQDQFMYGERAKGTIYYCKDDAIMKNVRKMVKKKKSSEEINKTINADSNLNITIKSGLYEKGDEEITKKIDFSPSLSDSHIINKQVVFMNIEEIVLPEVKPLNEARGLVTAAYQNELEKAWIKELRENHSIRINPEVLYSIK